MLIISKEVFHIFNMVRYCCICKIEQGMIPNVSFHSIPKKEEIREKWIINIGRKVSKSSSVCSRHFTENDYYFKLFGDSSKRLLVPTAIPSSDILVDSSQQCDSQNSDNEIIDQENPLLLSDDEKYNLPVLVYVDQNESVLPVSNLNESDKESQLQLIPLGVRDLHREHFTSDISWQIVRKYIRGSKRQQKALNEHISHLNNELQSLKSIIHYVKSLKQDTLEVNS